MARMSIDDKVSRDPRVLRLSKLCSWSRRETVGCLLEVWSICYDRVTEYVEAIDVDLTAGLDGFSDHMITCGLATAHPQRGLRISGVKGRIDYLSNAAKAGRKGGIKSGESRRNSPKGSFKQTGSDPQGSTNPLVLVPDVPSVPDVPGALVPDPPDPRALGRLAEELWKRTSEERQRLAKKFGVTGVLPFQPVTPSSYPAGFRDLKDRLREEGDSASSVGPQVIGSMVANAEATRSIEWLSAKAFTEGGWRTARDRVKKPKPVAVLPVDDMPPLHGFGFGGDS